MVERGIIYYFQDTSKSVSNAYRCKTCTAVKQLEFDNASFVTTGHCNANVDFGIHHSDHRQMKKENEQLLLGHCPCQYNTEKDLKDKSTDNLEGCIATILIIFSIFQVSKLLKILHSVSLKQGNSVGWPTPQLFYILQLKENGFLLREVPTGCLRIPC